MLTADDLKSIRRERMRVRSLQERIERLRSGAEYPVRAFGESFQGCNERSRVEEIMVKLMDAERELALEELAFNDKAKPVKNWISELPNRHAEVVREYYVIGARTWREVAETTKYSYKQVLRIRDLVLSQLDCKY